MEVDANSTNTDSGILIDLPREVNKDQMVELRFKSSVFVQSTRFDMFLQNSKNSEEVRQRVDPGDANSNVESDQITVDLPVTKSLLSNTVFNTVVITPNNDGINDQLLVDLGIINVI